MDRDQAWLAAVPTWPRVIAYTVCAGIGGRLQPEYAHYCAALPFAMWETREYIVYSSPICSFPPCNGSPKPWKLVPRFPLLVPRLLAPAISQAERRVSDSPCIPFRFLDLPSGGPQKDLSLDALS